MNTINRLKVIWVSGNVSLLLLMGLLYGLVFGGVSLGFQVAAGTVTATDFVINILIYGASYECMFLFVILIVMLALQIKGFISLGMNRKTIYQIWRDLLLYVSGFMVLTFGSVIALKMNGDELFLKARAFNMDINHIDLGEFGKILLFITLLILLLNLSGSFIVSVGNKFGMLYSFSAIAVVLGGILLSLPTMIELATWGVGYWAICAGIVVINCILFVASKKFILNTEVAR